MTFILGKYVVYNIENEKVIQYFWMKYYIIFMIFKK